MPEAIVLGKLLIMQSILINLPDKKSIISFVCRGLLDVPGVSDVSFSENLSNKEDSSGIIFTLKKDANFYGVFTLDVDNEQEFNIYHDYIKNFMFMLEVILEERHKSEIIETQNRELENRVNERTKQLSDEVKYRKKIEDSLRQSEELFRTSFESASAGVCLVSPSGYFIKVNKELCNILGYSEEELKKKQFNEITVEEDQNIGSSYIKDLISGKTNSARFEKRYRCKNGKIISATVSTALIKDDDSNPKYFITYIQDITEVKKTQKDLKESEKKYRSLFENMTTGFALHKVICNKNGEPVDFKYIEINPAYEKLTGLKARNIIGKTIKVVLPDIEKYWIETFGKVALTGEPASYQNYVKELDRYYDTWTFSPEKNYFAVVFTDVSEQVKAKKKLEETKKKLKKQNDEYISLNEELKQLVDELGIAKEKAEESDRLKSAFLANMSHEVRTPMNGIIGFSNRLLKPSLTEDKKAFYIKTIISCSEQLLKLVNDILDISKIEAGEIKFSPQNFVLNDLLMELFATYRLRSSENAINLYLSKGLNDFESEIFADKIRLSQILSNLVENAFKFTHQGNIKIGYKLENGFLVFFVEDTGIGIPTDMQEQIFERFRQVELDLSKQMGGTGLGLSISKKLVELQGGKIWLKSEYQKGATFYFSLPYKPVNQPEIAIKDKKLNHTILVAEDEETNYLLIEDFLTENEFSVLHARNGVEAIELSKQNPHIRLILMDIKMPGLNGYQAAKQIKKRIPDLPIIAQSAYAQEHEIAQFNDENFDGYITKPIDFDKLKSLMSRFTNTLGK